MSLAPALSALVARVLEAFERDPDEPQASSTLGERLTFWAERVLEWNQRIDLTAARSDAELIDLLLADGLALSRSTHHAESGEVWLDVGSGAGAPGIALALAAPELALHLVEPKTKRVAFLRSLIGQLELPRVVVSRARSETLASGSAHTAVSRATLPPAEWLEEGARLASRRVWVLLAQGSAPEQVGWQLEQEVSYRWPLTGVERRALSYVPTST